MSEVDFEGQELSEDEGLGSSKLVPVGEAIRYRKRAQSAEKQLAELEQQLKVNREETKQLSVHLNEMKVERELVCRLTAVGANDLEAALLMAKARMTADGDVGSIVEQLQKEKGYLFEPLETGVIAPRTTGVKERNTGGRKVLERAAKKAATSGSRADVQEYLKVRRQFVG